MIRRIATPAVGIAAIVMVLVLSLMSGGGASIGTFFIVLLAGVGVWVARERMRERGPQRTAIVERVGGCGLGPGIAVHAVRVADRVLVVGVSGSSIALLDTTSLEDVAVATPASREHEEVATSTRVDSFPAWIRRFGFVLALCASLAISADSASASQSESPRQSADLGPSNRSEQTPPTRPDSVSSAPLEFPPAPSIDLPSPGDTPLGPMLWLAALAVLPFVLMGLTSFVKISVVLSLLRSALGTPQVPSDPVLAGIALSLTAFVMAPVASEAWQRVRESNANLNIASGVFVAATAAAVPLRGFLERNARPEEVALFVTLSARNDRPAADPGSFEVLIPAFVTSELREAFVAGFFLFVPFLVVDLVVSNILMSMGMVMVSPTTVSLPFKILLFVLIDGWPLLAKALALSYH